MARHIVVESAKEVGDNQDNMVLFIILIVAPVIFIVTGNVYDIAEFLIIGIIWAIISIILISLYLRHKKKKRLQRH